MREQQNRLELLRQNSSNQAMASPQQTINPPTNVQPAHAPSPLDTLLQSTNGMNSNDPFRQNSSTQAMASSQQSINQPHPPPHALSSLDSLLQSMALVGSANGMNTGFIPPSQPVSQQLPTMPTQGISTDQQTDMFLRPAASTITSHGKPCRIVDYVSRLLPQDDRRVLSSEDGQARLVLDCGTKKVKLESVTIAQWNIANLRIFHHLINLGRLSTPTAVREYLAYTVKILELSTKFSWSSVLRYDDEYRTLQHIYGYSWSQDHSHLHEVILRPLPTPSAPGASASSQQGQRASGGNSNVPHSSSSIFATHTIDNAVICRNYNTVRGCSRETCHFRHACNRKVGGNACGREHPGCNHNSLSG